MSVEQRYESFTSQVEDDGSPARALDIAGQGVRDFNHRSFGYMQVDRPGWRYAPDAYRALGELTYLAGGLPQAFSQITAALRGQLENDLIAIDRGTRYEGDPAAAVDAARAALEQASAAAATMYDAIAAAQNAINAAAYSGPDIDYGDDDSW